MRARAGADRGAERALRAAGAGVVAEGSDEPAKIEAGQTAAEGIAIPRPPRGAQILAAVRHTRRLRGDGARGGDRPGAGELGRRGLFVEPTAALVWAAALMAQRHPALRGIDGDGPAWDEARWLASGSVVVPLCGSGLKSGGSDSDARAGRSTSSASRSGAPGEYDRNSDGSDSSSSTSRGRPVGSRNQVHPRVQQLLARPRHRVEHLARPASRSAGLGSRATDVLLDVDHPSPGPGRPAASGPCGSRASTRRRRTAARSRRRRRPRLRYGCTITWRPAASSSATCSRALGPRRRGGIGPCRSTPPRSCGLTTYSPAGGSHSSPGADERRGRRRRGTRPR